MATLFIAGASGYTGQALVRLASGTHRVIAHIRPGAKGDALAREFSALGVEVDRSPWEEHALHDRLSEIEPDCVFGLLGTTLARGKAAARAGGPVEDYETVDRDLSLMLARAAHGTDRSPRYVYLSSLGAGRPGNNPYLRARAEVEQALMSGPLPWTIARPSFITGADRTEDRPAERYAALAVRFGLGLAAAVGAPGLRDTYGELDASTLARALLRAALDPGSKNKLLEAAALRSLS